MGNGRIGIWFSQTRTAKLYWLGSRKLVLKLKDNGHFLHSPYIIHIIKSKKSDKRRR